MFGQIIFTMLFPNPHPITFVETSWDLEEIWLSAVFTQALYMAKNVYFSLSSDNYILINVAMRPQH